MKAKQHRQNYAKKQLKRRDPRRVCRAFSWHALHVPYSRPWDSIHAEGDHPTALLTITTTCMHCHEKIQTQVTVGDWMADSYGTMCDAIWRTWQYIIQEEPW